MYYYNQRIPIPLQRIEFKHILGGLQKQSLSQEHLPTDEPTQEKKRNKVKHNLSRLYDDTYRYEKNSAKQQQQETQWDEKILIKLQKLRKQPNTFFEKVPKHPVSLMNSSLKNKYFEIKILASSKDDVIKSGKESQKSLNSIQEIAVKEILNKYPHQFNFNSSADARKKQEVNDTKDKYMKTFFVNNGTNIKFRKKQGNNNRSDDMQSIIPFKNDNQLGILHKKTKSSYIGKIQELECPGYCTFIKQLIKKNQYDQDNEYSRIIQEI